jgi:hypothetical protein
MMLAPETFALSFQSLVETKMYHAEVVYVEISV